jgi:hypothetical protein
VRAAFPCPSCLSRGVEAPPILAEGDTCGLCGLRCVRILLSRPQHDRAPALASPGGTGACAVGHERCVGLDETEFVIVNVTSSREMHFCGRHSLAAEALATYAGVQGEDVAELLSRLEDHR